MINKSQIIPEICVINIFIAVVHMSLSWGHLRFTQFEHRKLLTHSLFVSVLPQTHIHGEGLRQSTAVCGQLKTLP